MKILSKVFKTAICCAFFISALTSCSGLDRAEYSILKANGKQTAIKAEIARTPTERAKGFMGRKTIPDGTGMLFVFDTEQRLNFWMKDTPHALSIAYIDKAGVIKEIHDLTPYSLETVSSSYSCMYALEVPSGWFEKEGIQAGDKILEIEMKH